MPRTAPLSSLLLLALSAAAALAEESPFARTTIDLGVVVTDVEKSVEFYTTAIGFQEAEPFRVNGEFCKAAGLTAGEPLSIRVLRLGEEESATRLKLMQVPEVKSKPSDNSTVPAQLGYSYITIFIQDTAAALKRLEGAGVKPIAQGPVPLPKGFPEGVFLTVVRDPDGNLVELVGPTKKNDN